MTNYEIQNKRVELLYVEMEELRNTYTAKYQQLKESMDREQKLLTEILYADRPR